jgi:hypothetical protein
MHAYCKWHNSYSHATNDCNVFRQQVQSAINEGRLKFAESPQMKLDKDPFPVNVNMVGLKKKKVLVQPSQVKSTKGKDVVIGEELPLKMIKPKNLKGGQWRKNEGASHCNAQRPPSTFSWLNTRKAGPTLGVMKTKQSSFPRSGQHIYSWELSQQAISDSAAATFRKSGSCSARLSSG